MSTTDISRRALRDQVHDRILQVLLAGDLEPGERITIDTMARDLAVSPHGKLKSVGESIDDFDVFYTGGRLYF